MHRVCSPTGAIVSYERYGNGPPLVLVHGAFSDHRTNWQSVKPLFERLFTVYAVARRGRGETDATRGHTLQDESRDIVALVKSVAEPVYLLGHSYGALAALGAAASVPDAVRKLVLYEPAWPRIIGQDTLARLEHLGQTDGWEELAITFFRDSLRVPADELEQVRSSDLWTAIVADAEASLEDLRSLSTYDFRPERFRELSMPVMLQVGSASPRELYVTDALAGVLPDCRIHELRGQAHEAMTTAPELYAEAVSRFLLDPPAGNTGATRQRQGSKRGGDSRIVEAHP